jgi:hypothetical protein
VSEWTAVVQLHDLDLLLEEVRGAARGPGAPASGPGLAGLPALERARGQLRGRVGRRWLHAYERAQRRYGRAVVAVRDRVCQGCFITLPTAAAATDDALTVCESCGRVLFWR